MPKSSRRKWKVPPNFPISVRMVPVIKSDSGGMCLAMMSPMDTGALEDVISKPHREPASCEGEFVEEAADVHKESYFEPVGAVKFCKASPRTLIWNTVRTEPMIPSVTLLLSGPSNV